MDNASIDVGNIPLPSFGQQTHLQDAPPSGYVIRQSRTPSPELPQAQAHIPNTTNDAFLGPKSSPLVQDIVETGGDVPPISRACFEHPTICPVFPECIGRYDRNVVIPLEDTKYNIGPFAAAFQMHENPLGWTVHHHPEGARYFYHEDKRVFTEANIYDDTLRSIVHSNLDDIDNFLQVHNIQRSPKDDLVLELTKKNDGKIETSYYFANHDTRVIYFLDEYDACNLPVWPEVQGVTSPSHIKHEIEVQYWYHCLLFPHALNLSHEFIVELRDIITYYISDLILSPTSTAPYNVEDMQKMLSLVDSLSHNVGAKFKGSTCTLSSLMYIFIRQRFLNFHGQPCARLNRDQSVYGKVTNKRSWLILLLSPVLFYAQEVHLRVLEKMGIDGLLHNTVWAQFITKLNTEWQEFTLYATVLLNANVAFLAIQSVDIDQDGYCSPAQVFSYISIMASIGSIILGLLLVRQNRTKAEDSSYASFVFPRRQTSLVRRLEAIAIMFSLPYALLMWGMVHFLAAFLSMCFQNSSTVAQSLVTVIWALITVLIAWCIWTAWEQKPLEVESKPESAFQTSKKGWYWSDLIPRRLPCISDVTVV